MKIECLIIHLERAHERRRHLDTILPLIKMNSHIIEAVDAENMSLEERGAYSPSIVNPHYYSKLKATEVACFLSHRKSWKYIVDNRLDAALILEDDADIAEDLCNRSLSIALKNIKPGDFVRFPIKKRETPKRIISEQSDLLLFEPVEIKLGMVAQLMTRDAAQTFLDLTSRFDRPVDCFLQMRWVHKKRILTVWPSGVDEISSELGGSMINHKAKGLAKVKREILRPIYRYKISHLSRKY